MSELLQDKKWFGAFFADEYEKRFSGEVAFSPESGVSLKYLDLVKTDISSPIHGVLSSGEKCSLLDLSGYTKSITPQIIAGLQSYPGTANFSYLLVGDYVDEEHLLERVEFSLTNLQEFFYAKIREDFVRHKDKPLLDIKTEFGRIKITNKTKFVNLQKQRASGLFYSKDRRVLDELHGCLERISEKFPDSSLMTKEDITYKVIIEFDSKVSVRDAHQHIVSLSDLFSIMLYCPVFPDEISAKKNIKDRSSLSIYPSVVREQRTVNLSLRKRPYHAMCVNNDNVDLEIIITKWLGLSSRFPTLISSIQRDTGYIDLHSAYGEFILYATQLEAISYEDSGPKEKKPKYIYPISRYATDEISERIKDIFSKAGTEDIGSGVSSLRGELAHVGRPQRLLKRLSFHDVADLGQYLQMAVLGFALEKLGIDRSVIDKYQNQIVN